PLFFTSKKSGDFKWLVSCLLSVKIDSTEMSSLTVAAEKSSPGAVTVPENWLNPPVCEPLVLVPTKLILELSEPILSSAAGAKAVPMTIAAIANSRIMLTPKSGRQRIPDERADQPLDRADRESRITRRRLSPRVDHRIDCGEVQFAIPVHGIRRRAGE